MRTIGFSTGALALGDFRHGLLLLSGHGVRAVELSALREEELPELMASLDELMLDSFEYVSIHAPSRRHNRSEREIAELLSPCIERGWSVLMHPDAIEDHGCWARFGSLLCLENMDNRKPTGRNAKELAPHFERLPQASFCLDLGHARQVDPTFGVARELLRVYGGRLAQLHLSEVSSDSRHHPLSMAMVWAVQEIARHIPTAPVILESVFAHVQPRQLDEELHLAAQCFQRRTSAHAATA